MNTNELFGKEVMDVNAKRIGTVVDIIFDIPPGVITQLVVRTGLLKKNSITTDKIAKVGDSVFLNIPWKNDGGKSPPS